MSTLQNLLKAILPNSWAQAMEAESRQWFMKCEKCGYEESYWDLGGIRWGAKGNSRNLRRCPQCGQRSWHQTYKKNDVERTSE